MLYFTIQNRLQDGTSKVSEAAGARWRFYPRISSDILGYPRIILESSFYWRKHFREFPMKSWASRFRGRRSIWWGWRVTLVAPRIGNDVSYVTQMIDDIHFAWQAQYLVRLEGGFTCSTHWKWGFICDADHWWHSFCVAGAVFGEVRVGLFVTGAALRDILGDSRSAKCCILQYKIVSKLGRVRSPKRRVRDDDFIVGYPRIIVESSFYWRKHFREFQMKSWASRFRGRRSIWWGWRVTLVAPRIGNEVSYVTQIIDDIHFAWQAQYLVRLEGDFTCSTHWKWGFICDADHWWHSFCVAGAVFDEVGGWLFVTGAALRDILGDSRDAKCCILQYKIVSKMGRVRSPKRRVRDDDFILGYPRIILGYPRIVFLLAEAFKKYPLKSWASRFRGRRSIWWGWRVTWLAPRIGNDVSYVTQIIDDIHFAWQAQYLVKLDADSCCAAHCKWRFKVVPE